MQEAALSCRRNPQALLIIDVINDFDFPEADQMLELALPMAVKLQRLKAQAQSARVPVIYVNDNFGRWQSDLKAQVTHCERSASRGKKIVRMLRPAQEDYFVLKPKHSGFYSTTLNVLLRHLGCRTLVITGVATNICVLFTANDAYMRDYQIVIPHDCCAANTVADHDYAIRQMEFALKADTRISNDIVWKDSANGAEST